MSSSNFPHLVRANCSSVENTRPTSTWVWTDTEVDIALLPLLMYRTGRSKLWGQERGLGRRGLTAGFLEKSGLRNGYSIYPSEKWIFPFAPCCHYFHLSCSEEGAAWSCCTFSHTHAHSGTHRTGSAPSAECSRHFCLQPT